MKKKQEKGKQQEGKKKGKNGKKRKKAESEDDEDGKREVVEIDSGDDDEDGGVPMVAYQNGARITITTDEGVPLAHGIVIDDEPPTEDLFKENASGTSCTHP